MKGGQKNTHFTNNSDHFYGLGGPLVLHVFDRKTHPTDPRDETIYAYTMIFYVLNII